jgi:hypothetical protein
MAINHRSVKPMAGYVWLIYSHEDATVLEQVRETLQTDGFSVQLNADDEPAIDSAECAVVLLSPDAAQSVAVSRQLDSARAHNLMIFPVIVRGDEWSAVPREFIGKRIYDIRANYERQIAKLMLALRQHLA